MRFQTENFQNLPHGWETRFLKWINETGRRPGDLRPTFSRMKKGVKKWTDLHARIAAWADDFKKLELEKPAPAPIKIQEKLAVKRPAARAVAA